MAALLADPASADPDAPSAAEGIEGLIDGAIGPRCVHHMQTSSPPRGSPPHGSLAEAPHAPLLDAPRGVFAA